jgi:hypothetical protein
MVAKAQQEPQLERPTTPEEPSTIATTDGDQLPDEKKKKRKRKRHPRKKKDTANAEPLVEDSQSTQNSQAENAAAAAIDTELEEEMVLF